jgi:glycopeptide antibiotics resistance protein
VITDVLIEHPWWSPTVLAAMVVLGPLVGRWLVPRPSVAWGLAAASVVPLLLLTLVPVDREVFERCQLAWAVPTPTRVELMANVVLFVAPVYFVAVAMRRPLVALLIGTTVSVGIEVLQAAVLAIGRSCDTTDWLSNTIGAAIGAGIGWSALGLARRRGAVGAG